MFMRQTQMVQSLSFRSASLDLLVSWLRDIQTWTAQTGMEPLPQPARVSQPPRLGKLIGKGSYGDVYAIGGQDSGKVAKRISKRDEDYEREDVLKEAAFYKIASDAEFGPSVQGQWFIEDNDYLYIIMESFDGNVSEFFRNHKRNKAFVQHATPDIELQLRRRLKSMIQHNILCIDIKPKNALYKVAPDKSVRVVLTDFGIDSCCDAGGYIHSCRDRFSSLDGLEHTHQRILHVAMAYLIMCTQLFHTSNGMLCMKEFRLLSNIVLNGNASTSDQTLNTCYNIVLDNWITDFDTRYMFIHYCLDVLDDSVLDTHFSQEQRARFRDDREAHVQEWAVTTPSRTLPVFMNSLCKMYGKQVEEALGESLRSDLVEALLAKPEEKESDSRRLPALA